MALQLELFEGLQNIGKPYKQLFTAKKYLKTWGYITSKKAAIEGERELYRLKKIAFYLRESKCDRRFRRKISGPQLNLSFTEEFEIKESRIKQIDRQIEIYSLCKKEEIRLLVEQLIILRYEYEQQDSYKLIQRITSLILRVKDILGGYIKQLKGLLSYLYRYFIFQTCIDRRSLHRRIIRFHFKNLSDNSGADVYMVNQSKVNYHSASVKKQYHEFKKRHYNFIRKSSTVEYKSTV